MTVLSNYIKRQLKKGFSISKIKAKLLEAGHGAGVVEKEIGKFEEAVKKPPFWAPGIDLIASAADWVKKNKKIIIYSLIGVAIVALLILAVVFYRPMKEKARERAREREEAKEMERKEELKAQLLAGCEPLTEIEEKDICYLKASKELDSTELCEMITKEPDDVLYYGCLGAAWREEDCGYEGLIDKGLVQCMADKAVKEGITFCIYLEEDDKINNCEEKVIEAAIKTKQIELCGKDQDCILEYALSLGDKKKCEDFEIPEDCYTKLAIKFNDSSYCDEVDPLLRQYCIFYFYTNEQIIDFFTFDGTISKSQYIADEAIRLNRTGLCEQADTKEKLYFEINRELREYDVDYLVSLDYLEKYRCLTSLAIINNEPDKCLRIDSFDWRNTCLSFFEGKGKCNQVTNKEIRELCQKSNKKDVSGCGDFYEKKQYFLYNLCVSYSIA